MIVINRPNDKKGIKAVSISFLENILYIAGTKANNTAKNIAVTPSWIPSKPPITPAIGMSPSPRAR